MATATGKAHCITCGKEKVAYPCGGCAQNFCFKHLTDHRQILEKQLDEVDDRRNIFRETLNEQKTNPQEHPLIQQINQWERDSIDKVRRTAEEARETLVTHTTEYINKIEVELSQLTEQLKEIRQEDDFNEINLNQLKEKLTQLEEELVKPSNISIKEDSSSFISKIYVIVSSRPLCIQNIDINTKWIQNGLIAAGGNGSGNAVSQLSDPWGVYVDDDQTIYIADDSNDRIVEWKSGATSGQIVAGGNGAGNQNNQLKGPRNVGKLLFEPSIRHF